MDDLIKEFIEETIESISELDTDLVILEKEPDNKDLLDKIFRLMHTIKGTCGFLSLPRLEKSSHAAENLLDLFRSGSMRISEEAMTILFLCIDRVRYLTYELHENGSEPHGDDQDIIQQIEELINKNNEKNINKPSKEENTDVVHKDEEKINKTPPPESKEIKNEQPEPTKETQNNKLNTSVVTDIHVILFLGSYARR
jgi:two-component system chemotaxis sensor kinase CheA